MEKKIEISIFLNKQTDIKFLKQTFFSRKILLLHVIELPL